jgi:citrate lyase subunit beta / citryl-CoA lyase
MTAPKAVHPRDVLLGAQAAQAGLPVCDHYCGVLPRMLKSLALQRSLMDEFGACVMDVTLDCEDGAPVGQEATHARHIAELLLDHKPAAAGARVGVRVHALQAPYGVLPDGGSTSTVEGNAHFTRDVHTILGAAAAQVAFVMLPKVETRGDVDQACAVIDEAVGQQGAWGPDQRMPVHVLIESPGAVSRVHDIAAHPRVQSLSFGLMDFVSAHGGAIPASAMGVQGQFEHPLVVRAKLEIASAAHAHGKVPSHCVVTEFKDAAALTQAATHANQRLGFTRMWSIHPDQVRPILAAFSPAQADVAHAVRVIEAALAADWAPVSVDAQLHDRASYRYFWQLLERAHATGVALPESLQSFFTVSH